MARTATLTVELPSEITESLDRLAAATQRDRAALVVDAIANYVAQEGATAEQTEADRLAAKEKRNEVLREVLSEARRRSSAEAVDSDKRPTKEQRNAFLQAFYEKAKADPVPGMDAARSQDFLYGDDGLPG
ncbi:MAG: ribbon-helix-helix domain-containing protein [Azospirillaceae bacterium]|nr:ribbon-helix-helix domain-containing protein [Azospirillaceae bacterium]